MDPNPQDPTKTHQRHDFNPDIDPFPNGLFWTTRIPEDGVEIDLEDGTASMDVADVALEDYFQLANALSDSHFEPAVGGSATCHVRWNRASARSHRRNAAQGFSGEFAVTQARMAWKASNQAGFSFKSDPIETSKSLFAQIGRERNGVFFS